MLDFQFSPKQAFQPKHHVREEIPSALQEAISKLSDRELFSLEDELDFFAFTGLKGPAIRRLEMHL